MIKDEEVFEACAGYIKGNSWVRRMLSQRVKERYLAKGPGALIVNIYDVEWEVPRRLDNAKEVLLNPKQTLWMSNNELIQKYGLAWQNGAREVYGLPEQWPELVKRSALFCRALQFEEWKDSFAENPNDMEGERQFYNRWGVLQQTTSKKVHDMAIRRFNGEDHPMDPLDEYDRAFYACFHYLDSYDKMLHVFAKRLPGGLKPVGRGGALWKDHHQMHGYGGEMAGFYMLSFSSTPYELERNTALPNAIDDSGWRCLGLETITFWRPCMEEMLKNAKSDEERVGMFTGRPEGAPTAAAIMYKGRSFARSLPSCVRQTTYACGNPDCEETERKVKSQDGTEFEGTPLQKCGRCEKEWYCSHTCQRADWKRHKKYCSQC